MEKRYEHYIPRVKEGGNARLLSEQTTKVLINKNDNTSIFYNYDFRCRQAKDLVTSKCFWFSR